MFEKKELTSAPPAERSAPQQTVIGPGIHIKGDIHGKSDVELKGTVEGNVQLDGLLVVGDGGRLEGDVSAKAVVVRGEVLGNIDARDKAQLCSNSKVKGNLRANALSIQEGALFEGRVAELPAHAGHEIKPTPVEPSFEKEPIYS